MDSGAERSREDEVERELIVERGPISGLTLPFPQGRQAWRCRRVQRSDCARGERSDLLVDGREVIAFYESPTPRGLISATGGQPDVGRKRGRFFFFQK